MSIATHSLRDLDTKEFRIALGDKIRERREAENLSQAKLAEMLSGNSDGSYISRIELGKLSCSIDQLYRIARALDIKLKDLVDIE